MINPNEPAFPIMNPNDGRCKTGLTIRAHFASLAMKGMIAGGYTALDSEMLYESLAQSSAKAADALIAELNKQ